MVDDVKTVWRLEMRDASALRPKLVDDSTLEVRRVEEPLPEFNWFLNEAVGVEFRWGGRDEWTQADWIAYVDRPELETWVAYVGGAPAGYAELEKQDDASVRIQRFGLLSRFRGRGLGGHLLTEFTRRAWSMGAERVWLSTCSHDHPHALRNYQARGFRVVDESTGPANGQRSSVLFTSGSPPR